MAVKYKKEQLWKLYEKLPDELKEAVFSGETADSIYDICQRNEIDEMVSEVASIVGHVLLGVLPPDEFEEAIKKELKLENDLAKKVAQEINRFVFYPVKSSLEELYGTEIAPPARPKTAPPSKQQEEKPKAPSKLDVYREPVE